MRPKATQICAGPVLCHDRRSELPLCSEPGVLLSQSVLRSFWWRRNLYPARGTPDLLQSPGSGVAILLMAPTCRAFCYPTDRSCPVEAYAAAVLRLMQSRRSSQICHYKKSSGKPEIAALRPREKGLVASNQNATTRHQPRATGAKLGTSTSVGIQALRAFWVAVGRVRGRLKIRVSVVRFHPWPPSNHPINEGGHNCRRCARSRQLKVSACARCGLPRGFSTQPSMKCRDLGQTTVLGWADEVIVAPIRRDVLTGHRQPAPSHIVGNEAPAR
jgi:hypothetical protein